MTASRERLSLQRILVSGQIAVSLVLLSAALLLVQTFRNLVTLDPGFRPQDLLVAFVDLSQLQLPPERRPPFARELLQQLATIPRVEGVATTTNIPLYGSSWTMGVSIDGASDDRKQSSKVSWVSPSYFQMLGVPQLAGRGFSDRDDERAPLVAIVNETFIARFFGGANPIGHVMRTEQEPGYPTAAYEIVGVVRDTKYGSLRESIQPTAFVPASQHPQPQNYAAVMIRSPDAAGTLPAALRARFAEIDRRLSFELHVFESDLRDSLKQERLMAALSGFFGYLAVAIAAVGLYGLVSYLVAARRQEFGVRLALGSTRGGVVRTVLGDMFVLVAAGLGLGAAAAFFATRLAAALLFGVSGGDVPTIVAATSLLAVVALLAAFLPARRAARLDLIEALRAE